MLAGSISRQFDKKHSGERPFSSAARAPACWITVLFEHAGQVHVGGPVRSSGGPADPGSWNRYAYAGNDPLNFNDPDGLMKRCPPGSHTDSTGFGCVSDSSGGDALGGGGIRNPPSFEVPPGFDCGLGKDQWSPCPPVPGHKAIGPNNADIKKNVADAVAFNNDLNSLVSSGAMNPATAYLARIDYLRVPGSSALGIGSLSFRNVHGQS